MNFNCDHLPLWSTERCCSVCHGKRPHPFFDLFEEVTFPTAYGPLCCEAALTTIGSLDFTRVGDQYVLPGFQRFFTIDANATA